MEKRPYLLSSQVATLGQTFDKTGTRIIPEAGLWLRLRKQGKLRVYQVYDQPAGTFGADDTREISAILKALKLPPMDTRIASYRMQELLHNYPPITLSAEELEVIAREDAIDRGSVIVQLQRDTLAETRERWQAERSDLVARIAELEKTQRTLRAAHNQYRGAESALTAALKYDPTEQNVGTEAIATSYSANLAKLVKGKNEAHASCVRAIAQVQKLLPATDQRDGKEDLGLADVIAILQNRTDKLTNAIDLSLERDHLA